MNYKKAKIVRTVPAEQAPAMYKDYPGLLKIRYYKDLESGETGVTLEFKSSAVGDSVVTTKEMSFGDWIKLHEDNSS
jgi:hypothetical protein